MKLTSSAAASEAFQAAADIARRLRSGGFRGVLVGGAVRDMLLGRRPDDLDMVTTAPPQKIAEILPEAKIVGASFGVFLVKYGSVSIELAAARSERSYMDGRHPEKVVYTADLALDAQRRDFTVNAMMFDVLNGELLDFTGGRADLSRGILRTVGNAADRFSEDYLRMLRAVRFSAKLGFELEKSTAEAIRQLAPLTADIAPERLKSELSSILIGRDPARAFRSMAEYGILRVILPEIDALRGVEQPPEFHPEGDVFTHTMLMLEHMKMPDALLAWSILFHDIGKPATFSREASGRIRFFGHEELGAEMCARLCARLRFSKAETEVCVNAVRNHMRFAFVQQMRTAKLKKLIASPAFPLELELHRLDCISCHALMDCFVFLLDYISSTPETAALPPPLVTGKTLIAAGYRPGPDFKRILDSIYERQLAGEFDTAEAALASVSAEFLEKKH